MGKEQIGQNVGEQGHPRKPRYEMIWRNKLLTLDAETIGEMADLLRGAAESLTEMAAAGVVLHPGTAGDDYATLVTGDPQVAGRFGFWAVEDWDEE